ncbi:MAG: cellulase family glycosylhydrolase [Candidatus Eremiobacteraeota bacterium]|nr:cellulase family glycosylhydrolase [Candidatus Eremiobacteraeota bacterium]
MVGSRAAYVKAQKAIAVGLPESAGVERLHIERGFFRTPGGTPVYLLGANYWPQQHGPWMYREQWDPAAVATELRQLFALGCNTVRIFCFTPDFLPVADQVENAAVDRLEELVALAGDCKMWSIPTFLVGHMSGENWQPEWAVGRDWFSDEIVLQACELLIATIARRFAGDPRIAGWLITNEWPLFAGNTSLAHATVWAHRLTGAVRSADPRAAVSLGDGAWDVIGGQQATLPATSLSDVVDFLGPHFYPKETDPLRHSLFAAFAMRMSQTFGMPVLLEEFGCSSDQASDDNAAHYYRTVLWSAFGAGNCGTLFWNSHDFPLADKPPYSHHPYELHFGVIRADGSLKPQAEEVRRFAELVKVFSLDEWTPDAPITAIGRSSYYWEDFPFDWGWTKAQQRDLLLQSYACAVLGGADPTFANLSRPLAAQLKVVFVPCVQQVTTADTAQLEAFVREGGTVYMSYGGEPWFPRLSQFIGALPDIRYGIVESERHETHAPAQLSLRFIAPFGSIAPGNIVQVPWSPDDRRAARLPCRPTDAQVIAVDERGEPALLERRMGEGSVVFMAYPLEYLALVGLNGNSRNGTWKIYQALALRCAPRSVRAEHPLVQCFTWRCNDKLRLIAINHGWEQTTSSFEGAPARVKDLESGETVDASRVTFTVKGVRAFEFATPH